MAPRLKVTIDRTAEVLAALKGLSGQQVLVGIPATTAPRAPAPDDPMPLNNAQIGYIMENGSPAANIPARPHLKVGVAAVSDQVAQRYQVGVKAVLDGRTKTLDPVHTAVGLVAEASVKRKITEGPFAPLAESTLAARRRRGRTGESPLLDTGQYRNSITSVVRPR